MTAPFFVKCRLGTNYTLKIAREVKTDRNGHRYCKPRPLTQAEKLAFRLMGDVAPFTYDNGYGARVYLGDLYQGKLFEKWEDVWST